jgi:hypothetical protein
MSRVLSVDNLYNKKNRVLDFTDIWLDAMGRPEANGCWFIWGNSSNGKTVFAAKLAKYLATFGRVFYNSLEEGASESLKTAFMIAGIEKGDRINPLDKMPLAELKEKLKKGGSPWATIIDSFQYSGLNALSYKALLTEFPNKLFVFISHADGKQPAGRTAKTVRYDADIKIWVEGYKAFPKSRYGGGEPITIWDKGSEQYYNETK